MKNLIDYREDARELVKQLYKDETGKPIVLTDGQCDIFNLIFKRFSPRIHIETFTRYGKSLVTALALLTRVSTFPEKFALVAGNDDQARIIMSYVIQHIFDNEYTKARFLVGKGESEENIRRYKNKDRLNFVIKKDKGEKMLLGELFITNAAGALGFGAPNVVMDESALVSDQDEALVFRMLGDQIDNFYVKIGNPWDMLHFRKSFEDPAYFKYVIDYKQGLMEGRISPEMIEEARKKPFFDVLYECKFPPEGKPDDEGWMPLLTRDDIDRAMVDEGYGFGVNKLGCDVAGEGRNFSVIVQRHTNLAELLIRIHTPDTMEFAGRIINLKKSKEVKSNDIFIDKNGIGKGVFDISAKELEGIHGVNVGERPFSKYEGELYLNLRAKLFWELRRWVLGGGKLLRSKDYPDCWYELCGIKYNKKIEGMKGKLQIMSKEKMGKEGIESPDIADALSLTFFTPDFVFRRVDDDFNFNLEEKEFNPHSLFPEI